MTKVLIQTERKLKSRSQKKKHQIIVRLYNDFGPIYNGQLE